jgi:hypothetical protein
MDNRIWKYTLAITDTQDIEMPSGARILSVANQNGELCLWALVPTANATKTRCIEIIGTGNPISPNHEASRRFIGTAVINPFVWHVFEWVHDSDLPAFA